MTFQELIKDSINPNSGLSSSKRLNLLISQFLFGFQILMDIIIHAVILLFKNPLPTVEFYTVMASVQAIGLSWNALIILWNLGAIKNVDMAFAKVLQQKIISPGESPVTDSLETYVSLDEINNDNVENLNTK